MTHTAEIRRILCGISVRDLFDEKLKEAIDRLIGLEMTLQGKDQSLVLKEVGDIFQKEGNIFQARLCIPPA